MTRDEIVAMRNAERARGPLTDPRRRDVDGDQAKPSADEPAPRKSTKGKGRRVGKRSKAADAVDADLPKAERADADGVTVRRLD